MRAPQRRRQLLAAGPFRSAPLSATSLLLLLRRARALFPVPDLGWLEGGGGARLYCCGLVVFVDVIVIVIVIVIVGVTASRGDGRLSAVVGAVGKAGEEERF